MFHLMSSNGRRASRPPLDADNAERSMTLAHLLSSIRSALARITGGPKDTVDTGSTPLLTVPIPHRYPLTLRVVENASGFAVYVGASGPIVVADLDTLALLTDSLISVTDYLTVREGATRTTRERSVELMGPPGLSSFIIQVLQTHHSLRK